LNLAENYEELREAFYHFRKKFKEPAPAGPSSWISKMKAEFEKETRGREVADERRP
jgi:hypothetical protein